MHVPLLPGSFAMHEEQDAAPQRHCGAAPTRWIAGGFSAGVFSVVATMFCFANSIDSSTAVSGIKLASLQDVNGTISAASTSINRSFGHNSYSSVLLLPTRLGVGMWSLWPSGGWEKYSEACTHAVVQARRQCHHELWTNLEAQGALFMYAVCGLAIIAILLLTSFSFKWVFYCGRKLPPMPPKYWEVGRQRPWSDNYYYEADVTSEIGDAVQELFDLSTDARRMGRGRDGAWATHRAFRVVRVTRIENGRLWSRYKNLRKSMETVRDILHQMEEDLCARSTSALEEIEQKFLQYQQSPTVNKFISSLGLDISRNERLLFHGAPGPGARDDKGNVLYTSGDVSPLEAIKYQGFDDRLGSVQGMYGSGTYFADMASKADQYAGRYNAPDHPGGSVGERASMFLSRVVVGCPYYTAHSLVHLRRPPSIKGHFDLNLLWNDWNDDKAAQFGKPWREKGLKFKLCDEPRFHSVMQGHEVDGQVKLFREFVVYQKSCYPEFCVEYERIAGPGS